MFSAVGPGAAVQCHSLELAFDQTLVEVEEGQAPQLVRERRLEDAAERRLRDGAPAEPGDDGGDRNGQPAERHRHVGREHPAEAHADGLLDDDDLPGTLERVPDCVNGEGPERGDAERTDPVPCGTLHVDDVLDRPEHRPHGHDHHVGIGAAVRVHQSSRVAPEGLGELRAELADAAQRSELAGVGEVAHLFERLRPDHGADGVRVCRVEDLAGLVRGQERIHLLLGRQIDPLGGVGQDEAVHADHDRDGDLLGQAEGLDVQVRCLLDRLGEQLDPSGVARRHGVAVVVPYVDGRADGPVGQGHDDREPEPAGVVDRLHHEQQTLARRGGEGTRAGGGGPDGDRHRGEFRFHVDELARGQLALLHQLAQRLNDVGLRRNGVGAHHLGPAQGNRFGNGPRALNLPEH